ncbi:MAG: hypothetical protein LBV79_04380 [Candidatus Adiutrix sp.]|jgi:signal transduction histidine kinase|nr:hypothetical protein [Candidatus Adiutrix sp.]
MKTSACETPPRIDGDTAAVQAVAPGRFTSLRLELMLLSVVLVLGMSGAMGLTVAWIYGRYLAESQLETALARAGGAALALAGHDDWRALPPALLERPASAPGRNNTRESLQLTLVVDARGRTVRRGPGELTDRDRTVIRAALAGGREEYAFDGQRVSAAAPIVRGNTIVGAVCYSGLADGLWSADARARTWILVALGLNMALMGLFSVFLLNRRLVTPLNRLALDLAALGKNTFKLQPRSSSSREIDLLFQAFDRTAEELMAGRRRLEEQLKTISETRAHLVASEKTAAVGRLASGLAHELGNPIGALTGFVHLLRQNDLSEDDKELILRQSAQELERMDGSIKEMLRFSRPSRREPEPVEAAEVVAAALSLARPQKWAEGLELALDNALDNPLVMAERNSLLQVLLNLLANAGQALAGRAGAGIRVVIEAAETEGRMRIAVRDNGPGVDPADAPHLFEPYFTRKPVGQGTGLGLAISQTIINGLGGSLDYAPNPGGGAVFTIDLPAAEHPKAKPYDK